MSDVMKSDQVEKHIRAWLQRFIVDLNLCPFARPLIADPALRISVCNADNLADLHHAFLSELDMIQQSSDQLVATSLMVIPCVLDNFDEYLDFLGHAEILLEEAGLDGIIQLASFHPKYLFADEDPNSPSHYSNRAPYPTIHFLREEMVSAALEHVSNPEQIPERNIALLSGMGLETVEARWRGLTADDHNNL